MNSIKKGKQLFLGLMILFSIALFTSYSIVNAPPEMKIIKVEEKEPNSQININDIHAKMECPLNSVFKDGVCVNNSISKNQQPEINEASFKPIQSEFSGMIFQIYDSTVMKIFEFLFVVIGIFAFFQQKKIVLLIFPLFIVGVLQIFPKLFFMQSF
jgi:hypothetical protein